MTQTVKAQENAKRADAYICEIFGISRNECVKKIEAEQILVNGKKASKKQEIKQGDEIEFVETEPEKYDVVPENIPLDIIYQDSDIAVINKPKGMVVHPAHGNLTSTLVHGIMYHIKDLSGINGVMRPGIVHRLDKNTSGLIIIAKNDKAHLSLAEQFKERTNEKIYLALVHGRFRQEKFDIEDYIGRSRNDRKKMAVYSAPDCGKFASTSYRVIEQFGDASLVECTLHTGRTHQIRVQLASISHPCIGDAEYGFKNEKYHVDGQALHSYILRITHPSTGERMEFCAPMPEYMQQLVEKLRKVNT